MAGRERLLVLEGQVEKGAREPTLSVSIANGPERQVPLAERIEILIPAGLPTGRVPIDLRPLDGVGYSVRRAGLQGSAPGTAEVVEGTVRQSGWATIDVTRWLPGGSVLEGSFSPPGDPSPGQEFALFVERQGTAPERRFAWHPGFLAGLAGDRRFSIDLGEEPGLVRLRLSSEGDGPTGEWRHLRVVSAAPRPRSITAPQPPRLVVLYVMDALRADALDSAGGGKSASPTWHRLSAEGATFSRHLSQAPNTLPSTKTLFVGRPFLARGGWKLAADGPTTLAELFAAAGFHTGLFSANPNVSSAYGTDRGFQHVAEEVLFSGDYRATGRGFNDSAERVQSAALEWLANLPRGGRAFLYLHTMNPHNPYHPPAELEARFTAGIASTIDGGTATLVAIKQRRRSADSSDRDRLRSLYTAGLAYNDGLLAELMAELERRVPASEILLVLTSDHGEELFDHGGVLHGYTLFDEMLRIPLALRWPGHISPARYDFGTDPIDLHATLRALVSGDRAPHGRSLWPELLSGAADRPGIARYFRNNSLHRF